MNKRKASTGRNIDKLDNFSLDFISDLPIMLDVLTQSIYNRLACVKRERDNISPDERFLSELFYLQILKDFKI